VRGLVALVLVLVLGGSACDRDEGMTLRSAAFEDGDRIPVRLSCEGDNVSPPLAWARVPEDAVELALVVADPDVEGGVFHHWVVAGLAGAAGSMDVGKLPEGAVQAKGSSENATWIGPCPPVGEEHEYVFTLYPLRRASGVAEGAELASALEAIAGARIEGAEAVLVGRFSR
jgi:Raf kinase inhibitor-like YbhB/YbcL family protein